MAGKKDKCVVTIITGLTDAQAARLQGEQAKIKNRIAPLARGTSAITTREGVGGLLRTGWKRIAGK